MFAKELSSNLQRIANRFIPHINEIMTYFCLYGGCDSAYNKQYI